MKVSLGISQVAVQHGHAIETTTETANCLWRQADLGNQHDRLPPVGHHLANRLDVHLRLATSGHTVQQNCPVLLVSQVLNDLLQRQPLIVVERKILLTDHLSGGCFRFTRIDSPGFGLQEPLLPQALDLNNRS